MQDSTQPKIIISDHFEGEKLNDLKKHHQKLHVNAYDNLLADNGAPEPRRLVGNYLTYLIKDKKKNYNVIIKKFNEEYSATCNCDNYEKSESCTHVGFVLDTINEIIDYETHKKDILNRQIEKNKSSFDENVNKNKMVIEKLQNDIKNIKTAAVKPSVVDPTLSVYPFVIPNARDFGFFKLAEIIPVLKNSKYRTFAFKEASLQKGYEVTIVGKNINEKVRLIVNQADNIEVRCSCGHTYKDNLCVHSIDTIAHLTHTFGYALFAKHVNNEVSKNLLLEPYGITLADEEAKTFEFKTDLYGRVTLSKIPKEYISVAKIAEVSQSIITKTDKSNRFIDTEMPDFSLCPVFYISHLEDTNVPLKLDLAKINISKKGLEKIVKFSIDREENAQMLKNWGEAKYQNLAEFSFPRFKESLGFSYYTQSYSIFQNQFYGPIRHNYLDFFYKSISHVWNDLSEFSHAKIKIYESEKIATDYIDVTLHKGFIYPEVTVETTEKFIIIRIQFTDEEGQSILDKNDNFEIFQGIFVYDEEKLYLIKKNPYTPLLKLMSKGFVKTSIKNLSHIAKDLLLPLQDEWGLELPEELKNTVTKIPMSPVIYFSETQSKYLSLLPKFDYNGLILEKSDNSDHYIEDEGRKKLLLRDKDYEEEFIDFVKTLHPSFNSQTMRGDYILSLDEAMKNLWFVTMTQKLQAKDIKMVGINELKNIRFNPAKPKWEMKVSSGIDWFDIHIEISWGEQVVSFRDVRKAIINKQNFITLGDGSFGMLPEDWLTQYKNMFKLAVESADGLKISKKHFNVIELLFEQIDDLSIKKEIEEKKAKLLNIENIKTLPIPKSIIATLRPYQENGYKWMQILDDISWGGCLADDMGLGKTLQTITFLAFLKEKYNNPTSLIVCPTSLMFNWEAELNKFAPHLKYHVFYGQGRDIQNEEMGDYDIIITSYGIIRNDIERLMQLDWEYVVLDESQAIKNPDAITTKAVQLLKSRNRLILSGTPLQNNTFDIFAQFNFINPGLLGNKDFFKREFANPIDKGDDPGVSTLLRQMIKPFMLRRTKSEVAPDLPEKTETILWCQMDKAQQTIYDEYKNFYRNALMERIEKDGINKSGMYILEGLLRLRQICDDPRLIKDPEIHAKQGVKIKELLREISENMGHHKMLIFSQFTEMLGLIRTELDQQKIPYCYLDGGTSAKNRQQQVEIFQNEDHTHVFLVSLKAGGVGLNLTAAEYVYLVDPWWNPAVEQQAIDRTHRIGQKNKIFAYKMICKDSVEEKIMKLQERKLSLSREIIQDDSAFFKSLTLEDIGFLFS